MTGALHFVEDDLTGADVVSLLRLHLDEMHRWSPPESVHAMPVERLRQSDVTFWSAWDGNRLAGCGALKQLEEAQGEIKSMRAHPDYRRRGAGQAILDHLIAMARDRGWQRLSLETGTTDDFLPARRLYEANGFVHCGPFADYREDPFSVFMTRAI
jgi:putative acetyltransferase